jgi:hypothetical protein
MVEISDTNREACEINTAKEAVHPLASVAVTLYVPAVKPVAVVEVSPVFHKYVIVPVPPVADTVAFPLVLPKQIISV